MPKIGNIFPYFHPTTVILVDDDLRFLDVFRKRSRRLFPVRTFSEPEQAIKFVRQSVPAFPRHIDCLRPCSDLFPDADWRPSDQAITFRPDRIRDLVFEGDRFAEISVVIVDYDMPTMNGLEVCRRIRDLPVKKLMLTGKADKDLAVVAFNEGLIDRFLIKHDVPLSEGVDVAVAQLQSDFFQRNRIMLDGVLGLVEQPFLSDPDVCQYLATVFVRENAVEYYLSAAPPGMLMLRADNSMILVLIQDAKALRVHEELARDSGMAPHALLAELARRVRQPWFPTESGAYDIAHFAWERHLYAAERIGPWYCSMIETDAAKLGMNHRIISYNDYFL
jgi:CheY-like chemotaxis protein